MKRFFSIIILIAYCWIFLFADIIFARQNEDKKIVFQAAILPFQFKGIERLDALNLEDVFRNELNKTGEFNVLTRPQLINKLREKNYRPKGACNTPKCYAEIGITIGVDLIITGNITQLGNNQYTIGIQVVDVQKARIIQTANRDYNGSFSNLPPQYKEIAAELARPYKQPKTDTKLKADVQPKTSTKKPKTNVQPQGNKSLLWISIGVLSIGAGTFAFLSSKNQEQALDKLPDPPTPPQ